jgi:hypothetical protein
MFPCAPEAVKPLDAILFPRAIDPDEYRPTEADLEAIDAATDGAGSDWWRSLEEDADAVEMSARADEAGEELARAASWVLRLPKPEPDWRPAA